MAPECGIVIVNEADLMRASLRFAFSAKGARVTAMPSVAAWRAALERQTGSDKTSSIVLLCIGAAATTDEAVCDLVEEAKAITATHAVVIMGDINSTEQVIGALRIGARGYIPTSTPLEVALEALSLVRVGGLFVPVDTLIASLEESMALRHRQHDDPAAIFTERQLAVVEALRQGKANKVIAYELDMCESTVKVHVRNIMRKLKASNRTEVAYRTQTLFGS